MNINWYFCWCKGDKESRKEAEFNNFLLWLSGYRFLNTHKYSRVRRLSNSCICSIFFMPDILAEFMNYRYFCWGKGDKASRKETEFNYFLLWLFKHGKLLIENANYKSVKILSNYHWERRWLFMKRLGNCRTFKTKSNNAETFNIFSNISGLSWTRHSGMLRL